MNRLTFGLPAVVIGITWGLVQTAPAVAMSIDRLNQIAAAVTVRIQADRPSSGVLIGREGDRYTVLTTRHGVQVEDNYAVITPDGKRYPVEWRSIQPLPNLDLALVQFRSSRSYATAQLGAYVPTANQTLFLSGFPAPGDEVSEQIRLMVPGQVVATDRAIAWTQDPFSQGYRLFYRNIADLGMSGGPLLDLNGRVVGIHGRSEGEIIWDPTIQQSRRLHLGISSGILIQTLLQYQPKLQVQATNTPPPLPSITERQAIATLEKTLLITPAGAPSAITWANYSNSLYRLGRLPEALNAIDRALELQFKFPQLWYAQGLILSEMQRQVEALNALDQATKLQPRFYKAWQAKAIVLRQLGRPIAAVGALDQALQIDPQSYVALYFRASVLGQDLQQPKAALEDLDRALRIQPEFFAAWLQKSRFLQAIGNPSAALVAVDQALALEPHDREAQAWRAHLLRGR